jgi:CBS domain-containing protein
MQVRDIMTPSAELIDANTMIRDAAVRMRDRDLGALPVGDGGRLIGMVTDRDIVTRAVAADRGGGITAVREVMSEGLYTCYDDASVEEAARLMAGHHRPIRASHSRSFGCAVVETSSNVRV